METRPGCRVHAIIVTSCHGNDDEAWDTSCLIMQHKPYTVEQPPMCFFKSYYHYTKVCKLHGVGVQGYKTDDRDIVNYSLKSDLNSVLNVTLVHVPHWSGVVPPWSVMVLH